MVVPRQQTARGGKTIKVSFGHHLSLSYRGGGEKWLTQLANELIRRGHDITIRCLPFWKRDNPINLVPEIDHKEGYFHFLDGDVNYLTYNPLFWLNFRVKGPKIGGMHSACYWSPLNWKNGLLINLATIVNAVTSRYELAKFDIIHRILDVYPVNHPNVVDIPNFVDSTKFRVTQSKNEDFTVGFCSRKTFTKGYDIWLKIKQRLGDEIVFIESGNIPEDEMADFYSRCHVIVVPARSETFGLTVVESLLCGTEVLSSGHLIHRVLGLPLNYANTIPEYVNTLLKLREGNGYSGAKLRKEALKYDVDTVIDKIEKMFLSVSGVTGHENIFPPDRNATVNRLEQMLYKVSSAC